MHCPSSAHRSVLCLLPFLRRKNASGEGIWLLIPWLSSVSPPCWAHPLCNHFKGKKNVVTKVWGKGSTSHMFRPGVFNATRRAKGMEDRYLIRHFCLFHLKKRHRSLLTLICLVLALIYCSFCNIFGILQATPLLNFTDWGRLKLWV